MKVGKTGAEHQQLARGRLHGLKLQATFREVQPTARPQPLSRRERLQWQRLRPPLAAQWPIVRRDLRPRRPGAAAEFLLDLLPLMVGFAQGAALGATVGQLGRASDSPYALRVQQGFFGGCVLGAADAFVLSSQARHRAVKDDLRRCVSASAAALALLLGDPWSAQHDASVPAQPRVCSYEVVALAASVATLFALTRAVGVTRAHHGLPFSGEVRSPRYRDCAASPSVTGCALSICEAQMQSSMTRLLLVAAVGVAVVGRHPALGIMVVGTAVTGATLIQLTEDLLRATSWAENNSLTWALAQLEP